MNDYIFKENIITNKNNNILNNKENTFINQLYEIKNNNNNTKPLNINNKIKKNKYFIALVFLIVFLYYIFLFYCIFPLYEASCIYYKTKSVKANFNNETNLHNSIKDTTKILNIENPVNSSDKDLFQYLFMQEKIVNVVKMIINNKGYVYLTLFSVSFFLFLVSICRLSVMDPGKFETEYKLVYNVRQYCEFYFNFCKGKNCDMNLNKNNNNNYFNGDEVNVENRNAQVTQDCNDYNNNNNLNSNKNTQNLNLNNNMLDNLKSFLTAKAKEINSNLKAEEKSILIDY